jgi:hypothetical protein
MTFVNFTSKDKTKSKNITKFSSICSQHFRQSDFSGNGTNKRQFLRKYAIPSIDTASKTETQAQTAAASSQTAPGETSVQIIVDDEPLIEYELCGLCRSQSTSVVDIDDYHFTIRKCLPFINFNLSLMQNVCKTCVSILNTFSTFIDRVIVAQNILNQDVTTVHPHQRIIDTIPRNIKLEPLPFEDELVLEHMESSVHEVQDFPVRASTGQKKCEILEIIDIKQPLNFLPFQTNALARELNESNVDLAPVEPVANVHILSPNQLKVEINDQEDYDVGGENEFEHNKNYILLTAVHNHDHNYVRDLQTEDNVKIELDDESHGDSVTPFVPIPEEVTHYYREICCGKKFNSIKRFLMHKLRRHNAKNSRNYCVICDKKFVMANAFQRHKYFQCKRNKSTHIGFNVSRVDQRFDLTLKHLVIKRSGDDCKPKMKRRISRRVHKTQIQQSGNQCPICKKSFKAAKNLYQHKTTHNASKYVCNICKKSFKMKHGLKQHIMAQHEKKKIYTCTICHHNYALKGDLKRCRHSDLKRKA